MEFHIPVSEVLHHVSKELENPRFLGAYIDSVMTVLGIPTLLLLLQVVAVPLIPAQLCWRREEMQKRKNRRHGEGIEDLPNGTVW